MSRDILTPEQQFDVLAKIWNSGQEGYVFLPWIPGHCSRDERRRNWNEGRAYEWKSDRPDEKEAILAHIRKHQKNELYFTPAKFLSQGRTDQSVDEGWVAFADLDEVSPDLIERAIMPSICWESSPDRYQAVWLMRDDNVHAYDHGGINQRLTYFLGADPSGWDAGQVLRVPGKPNYKPEYRADNNGKPVPGYLLWAKSRTFEWAELDQALPSAESLGLSTHISAVEQSEIEEVDRHAVWNRVHLKVSKQIREYLSMKSGQITEDHDRSEIVWQISRELADAGCSVAEIVAILQKSPWNKFEGRSDELTRLQLGAIRAVDQSSKDDEEEPLVQQAEAAAYPSTPLWISQVAREPITRPSWLVHNIWAKGSVGFIAGQPKSYKSYIALDMALSVASGMPFLNDSQFNSTPAKVLYLQEEDTKGLVMHRANQIIDLKAPERSWNGVLRSCVEGDALGRSRTKLDAIWVRPDAGDELLLAMHVREGFQVSHSEWQFWLLGFIQEHGFELVVIDTLGTTVGDIDTDKATQLNDRVLRPLKAIAEETGCAIAVVHHNRKTTDNHRSGQQMLGSVALHAWVESALYVQSKDTLERKPPLFQVKVERENKLAEDMKFRIRIPYMYEDHRGDSALRQLWEPEVHLGWGDEEAEEKKAQKAVERRGNGGLKLARFLHGQGYLGKFMMPSEIARVKGSLSEKQAMVQILAGVSDGNFEDGHDGTYAPV